MRIVRYSRQGEVGFGILEDENVAAISPHPFAAFEYTGERFPTVEARQLAPVLPTKVVAVGRNYADHAREMGGEVPADPVIFLKPSTSVIGPGDPIVHPGWVGRVDYEGELAVIVGKLARRLNEADAIQAVLGFTCANDVTALDSSDLALRTLVNGEPRQQARTSQLERGVASLLSFVSQVMTLLPGDVLLTGTPAGVGPLEAGDRVEVEVEGIGVLANQVVGEDARPRPG